MDVNECTKIINILNCELSKLKSRPGVYEDETVIEALEDFALPAVRALRRRCMKESEKAQAHICAFDLCPQCSKLFDDFVYMRKEFNNDSV